MIYVHIKKELAMFETDIRDLCLAFFTLQKITYVFENDSVGADIIRPRMGELREPDIIVKDYYTGPINCDRLTMKSELKRQLYNYLSKLTGKKLLWGTLTGIRPVNIVTKMIEDSKDDTVGVGVICPSIGDNAAHAVCGDTVGAKHCEPSCKGELCEPTSKITSDSQIKNELKKEYYINDLKANELIKIAHKEIDILSRPKLKDYKESYSIYIGVPFCKSTCLYCSFTSFNIEKFGKYVDSYLEALEKEFKFHDDGVRGDDDVAHAVRDDGVRGDDDVAHAVRDDGVRGDDNVAHTVRDDGVRGGVGAKHCEPARMGELYEPNKKLTPLTLYIGGGTPTSLDETAFERLLTIIDKYVDKNKCIEYTVEAGRPDTITKEKLLIMKKHGVTRISINPQTFNQKTLDLIGRKHTVKDVVEKFKLARSMGFDNINMDIILGLPNEHLFEVLKTLNGIRKLKPDSFTVHSLALKRAARLNFELDSWTKNYYLAGIGKRARTARPYDDAQAVAASYASGKERPHDEGARVARPCCRRELCERKEGRREIDKMFKWSERLANFLHLEPYYLYRQKNMAGNLENVGYAKDGKECVYNIMMMSERHTVYGFGTATTKKIFYENGGSKRIESEEGYKSVIDYCKSFNML